MSRVLRSMTYRLIRNKLFWLILAALVVLEVLTLFYGSSDGGRYSECFVNHKTYTRHDHDSEIEVSEYAEFEKEDPLLINKLTQNIYMGKYDFVPGQVNNFEVSLNNCGSVSELLAMVLFLIFAADAVFIVAYFGEMFSDGAVRNMVAIKTNKMIIYLISLFINAIVCLVMYILVFAALAVSMLIAGFYPMIYVPAFVSAVLVGLLVTVTVTSFFIFVLFVDQNPMLSFILCALIVALSLLSFEMAASGTVFERKYNQDEVKLENFFKNGGYRISGEGEWYLPVNDFNIGRAYYPADDQTVEFLSEEPNPYYPDEKVLAVSRALYRANIMNYPCEISMFFIYPMYRDGLLLRYIAFSSGYLVILLTGGCYVISKRNFN